MGTYTKNLKLETPSYTDNADIPALTKKNNEIIDSEMIKRANGLDYNEQTGVLQLTGNNSKVGSPIQIKNNLPVTSMASGTELKVNNYKQLIKFTKEGKTEQKTYTGKNLLNYADNLQSISGLTNTINSDGSITTIGTPTKDFAYITKDYVITDMLEDGQTYTISQALASSKLYLQINARKKSDKTYIHIAINNDNVKSKSFKADKSTYDLYSVNIQTTAMSIWGSSSLTITNKYMLCKGTDTADSSFEPYVGVTPSPNPDYPQEIVNVRGIENLFKPTLATTVLNGITCAANRDGTYTLNGTATADTTFTIGTDKNLIINKTYKFLGCPNGGSNTTYRLSWNFHDYEYGNGLISKKTSEARNVQITIFKGITASNLVFKPMFTEDTLSTYNDYVPYGSNYLQLENVGENILNIDETPFTVKKITSQGNVLYWSGYSGVNDFVKVKEKTTYKFSSNEVNKVCYIDYYDKNKNYLSRTGTAVDYFTTPENCKYIKFAINLELIPTNAQLREGTIIKSYEPYKEKIINVDLKGNNLCSNKDKSVKDELLVENGKAKIYKKIKEVVLNGTEGFAKTEEGFVLVTNDWGNKNKSATLSNYFTTYTNYSEFKEAKEGAGFLYENVNNFYIKIDGATTVNEFRAKLKSLYNAGTPVKVQYELAEPKVIDLGKVDFDLIENSTLTCEEESDMQIDYLTIDSNIFVQDSLDGNSSQKAPSVDAIKKYFGKKVYDKDANGWIKIEFFDHTEYVTEGQITQIDFSTGWGVSKLLSLPVGMSTIGDRILSGNVRTFDAAISVNISGILTETQITYNWKNNHSSNVTTGLNYSLRILEYV